MLFLFQSDQAVWLEVKFNLLAHLNQNLLTSVQTSVISAKLYLFANEVHNNIEKQE